MAAVIKAIAHHLPDGVITNQQLAEEYPDWTVEKIQDKTGIRCRHIVQEGECASDLGVSACLKLLSQGQCRAEDIDFLILCTQSPDYYLPTTACLMQERLGLSTNVGSFDFNLGCSGYIYGLGLAKGLVETQQAQNVLLVTAETYSKHINAGDKSVRTLFGDAASATLISNMEGGPYLGPFVYGTDGRGGKNLIVPTGGMRQMRAGVSPEPYIDEQGNTRTQDNLYMDGPEIFTFTLRAVPPLVEQTLQKAGLQAQDIDYYIFHQANAFMLESLRRKIKIPKEKFVISFEDCGNTVSSTIPIALQHMVDSGIIRPEHKLMLVGFGVGYSWGAAIVQWVTRA